MSDSTLMTQTPSNTTEKVRISSAEATAMLAGENGQLDPPEQPNSAYSNGAAVKVAPIPPDRYTESITPNGNGATNGASTPSSAGVRIPIENTTRKTLSQPDTTQMMNAMPAQARAAIPDVMADDVTTSSSPPPQAEPAETVEQTVNRLRPKSIRMQFRFIYTVVFALWLFGRLVFWQVYVAKLFPQWVNNRNTKRWKGYAREFRKFAIRMGGVQIKAGQFASTRADVLPEEVIEELAGLQDKVPTLPFDRILRVIKDELTDIDARFNHIEPEPIAAASLGQVHRAQLTTGESVVVKVQRPRVRRIIYTDMAALFVVGHVAMRFEFVRRRMDAGIIIEEFGRVLLEEVSYEKETDNARRFARIFADDPGIYVPSIYEEHSTDKLIVMEDVTSIKIDDYARLAAAGVSREEVAQRLMDTYLTLIFEERFFHADPHPGNLFIYPLPVEDESVYIGKGGRPFYLIFIDFGMTGTLTREIVQGLINTLTAIVTRDAKRLVASYKTLGFLLPSADTRRIEEATNAVFDEVWGLGMGDMANVDYEVVEQIGNDFNDLIAELPFRIPQDFVYLGRTVAILTGMAIKLDPTYNPWTEIQKRVQTLVTTDEENNIFDEFAKILQDSVDEIIADGPQGIVRVTQRFLQQFQRVSRTEKMLQKIIDGEVVVETRMSGQQRLQFQRIEAQSKRNGRIMLVASLLICATLFYTNGDTAIATAAVSIAGVLYASTFFIRR
ncbi:MAG: AarF/UbiB family protein [Chloroflexota bacterium]